MADIADKIRQDARAKEQRIETALAAIEALTPDEAEFVYVKLEKKILGTSAGSPAPASTPKPPTAKPKKTKATAKPVKEPKKGKGAKKINKATITPSKFATKSPSYAERAEAFITANPQGVRTYEIGKAIGQSVPNVFGTLKLLEGQGRVERHGERYKTLWTAPGVKPVERIETIDDAIVHVLSKSGPMHGNKVRAEVAKLLRDMGKKVSPVSLKTMLSKLVTKGAIMHDGADENGILYAVTREKGEPSPATLN